MDARLRCPFIMQAIGPSQSGKTSFVGKLIKYSAVLFEKQIDKLVWFSPHKHLPAELKTEQLPFQLHVRQNLPQMGEEEEWSSDAEEGTEELSHTVYVIDDFGEEAKNNRAISSLYTRGSHHRGITVIQILQNLFLPSRESRTRSLNVHYFVLLC